MIKNNTFAAYQFSYYHYMGAELFFEYPIYFVIPCVLLGILYTWLLYTREDRLQGVHKGWKIAMNVFRFLAVTSIALLLISPLLKYITREVDKPVIVVAQDNSASLISTKDASYYKNQYPAKLRQLIANLQQFYEVKTYSFGSQVQDSIGFSYQDKQTNMADLFTTIETTYGGRNLGAIVLASDGIYNKGNSPIYAAEKFKCPIYCLPLGDPSIQKDVLIAHVSNNKIAYLKNNFPIEVLVQANECKGSSSVLSITKNGKEIASKTIDINSKEYNETVEFRAEADNIGMQHYTLQLTTIKDEVTTINNTTEVFVEVIDNREKILVLGNTPHPDMAAIKQSLELNELYQVEVATAKDFKKNIKDYNLVIFHQLPSTNFSGAEEWITQAQQNKIGVWYILGETSNIAGFNNLATGVSITGNKTTLNDAFGTLNTNFATFTLADGVAKEIGYFPPMGTPFGTYSTGAGTNVLAYQKIGSVPTTQPLWYFAEKNGQKIAVTCGEGLWKWRLADYEMHENHEVFNELVNKTAQYVSLKMERTNFKVSGKNRVEEDENILFDAELYNDSYEAINTPEVRMSIVDAKNKEYKYTFSKTEKAYKLNAGILPVGSYTYKASTEFNGKKYAQNGEFIVTPILIEQANITANHSLLAALASQHKGEVIPVNNMLTIVDKLQKREDVKPISFIHKEIKEFINLQEIFFVLLALLSLEWFIRKRNGAY